MLNVRKLSPWTCAHSEGSEQFALPPLAIRPHYLILLFHNVQNQEHYSLIPVSILYKSIAGRYRPVRVADGPITACYRFIKNASWDYTAQAKLWQKPFFA